MILFSSSWGIEPKSKLKILYFCHESNVNTFNILNYIYLQHKFLFFQYLFIFILAAPGLSCGTWDLQLRHVDSQLWHACRIQFPDQGSNLGPLHWEHGVLPTGPPRKSLNFNCFSFLFLLFLVYLRRYDTIHTHTHKIKPIV